jgi:glucosamine-6-phosphate deaminase
LGAILKDQEESEKIMDIIIKKDYQELSRTAADIVAAQIKAKPDTVLGLATGSTPIATYHNLVEMHRRGLDFSRVRVFHLDEYLGITQDTTIPYEKDQSYARFLHEELLNHINIPKQNIFLLNGTACNPEQHCAEYEKMIKAAGGIDLQLLGLGGDGHWAFNEPGSSLGSRTRVQALAEQTLNDNYDAFYQNAGVSREQMPVFALTMGIGTILESKSLIMLISGLKKARIAAKALEGPLTSRVPASAIQLFAGIATVVLDEPAATSLQDIPAYLHLQELNAKRGLHGFKHPI